MKKFLVVALSVLLCFVLVGCGGPKKVSDQQMTLSLSYGDRSGTYTGEVNDKNVPNGKGKFTTKNSKGMTWVYEGQFKDGHFDGSGKTTWPDLGRSEEGTYSNDRLNGQGRLVGKYSTQNNYEGNFENGVPMVAETANVNEAVTYADWEYKITQVKEQTSAGNKQPNGRYVVVVIDDQNNGTETRQPAPEGFFVLYNKQTGATYKMDGEANLALRMSTKDWNGPWYLSEVNPGLSVSGISLFFDVPKDVQISDLKFLPKDGFGKAKPIQLQ